MTTARLTTARMTTARMTTNSKATNSKGITAMNELVLSVPGMTCGHCEASVKGEVGKVAGVTGVAVDLATKLVTITGEALDRAAVVAAVDEAGFEVAS